MSRFPELIDAHTHAANIACHPETPFNDTLGDLVLRNTVVALDRIDAAGYATLTPETKALVKETAELAEVLAPMDPADTVILPQESPAQYAFRLNVSHPIGNLQRKMNIGSYKPTDPTEIAQHKKALHLGAAAFAAVVGENLNHTQIQEAEGYFWGNTNAAGARAERLTQ